MSLTIQDFKRVIKIPKDFLVGFISQVVLLPIIALLIALLLKLSAELAIGLMLIACAPGGVTSNVLTKFADGDVALSISLTAVVSLISIISVPFIMFASIDFFEIEIVKKISMTGIALKMFLVVTVPVIIGMIIRHFAKNFVDNQASLIQKISVILFVLVFAAIYIEEWDNIITYFAQAGLPTLMLKYINDDFRFLYCKIFCIWSCTTKMYFNRMWTSKWNFSTFCWDTDIW